MAEQQIGEVSHYFNHLGVAIIDLKKALKKGDKIHIKGHTSDFSEVIESMQVDHEDIEAAKAGQVIGIKVKDHARVGDSVFKVTD